MATVNTPLFRVPSAGIGRTGTFIALDILTHQVETTGQVSVFLTVQRLRKQRVNMVQTPVSTADRLAALFCL